MIGDGGHARQILAEFGEINVIAIGDNRRRKHVAEVERPLDTWDIALQPIWHHDSNFMRGGGKYTIGEGSQILRGAVLGVEVKIGRHCILNHQCTVDHDAELADYVHVAPGARVLGGAKVGEGALIGANAVVLPNAVVPPWAVVRACSVYPSDYNVINGKPTTRKERPVAALEYAGREKLLLDFQRDT